MGAPKGLMQIQDKPWVFHQVEAFRKLGGTRIILVLGYDAEAYRGIDLPGVEKVINQAPGHGPFTSIQTGARVALERSCSGAFVLPIDVPAAEPETWTKLLDALKPGVRICQPIFKDHGRERGGHPALVSCEELAHLLTVPQTGRLDARIHELGPGSSGLARVSVDDYSVLVNLNSPEDWARFQHESKTVDEIGKCAALLSVVEIGLGSILHSAHIPTSGHWLSVNQAFWLSRATYQLRNERDARLAPMTISNVTASLKTLSPAGKKLTPMLAISAQGGLFNLGTLLAGRGLVGTALGSVLLSVWAFIQPVAIYYLIFGGTLIEAYVKLYKKTQEVFHFSDEQALYALVAIIGGKALIAAAIAAAAYWLPQRRVDVVRDKLTGAANRVVRESRPVGSIHPARQALRDLFNPLFLVSLALTLAFFVWAESSHSQLIWAVVRPIAVGFLIFFGVRVLPAERALAALERMGFHRFAAALRVAKNSLTR